MACNPDVLKHVPLFGLLDDDELSVLAGQVELVQFDPRERIYKIGDEGVRAYVIVSGSVEVVTVDEDGQEVVVDQPAPGQFFGFASMIDGTPHQTSAVALEATECIEVDRNDISILLQRKPMAGMDLLTTLGRQFHASHQLVRVRSSRHPNDIIEEEFTLGDRVADSVAKFGGSWSFIITFGVVLIVYSSTNIALGKSAWDPYPFILLNLFLSMLAAIQAPVIMMSQNRQDTKDRLRGELDYDVNRRAESEIQGLSRKLNLLGEKIGRRGFAPAEDIAPATWGRTPRPSGGAKIRGGLRGDGPFDPLGLALILRLDPGLASWATFFRRPAAQAERRAPFPCAGPLDGFRNGCGNRKLQLLLAQHGMRCGQPHGSRLLLGSNPNRPGSTHYGKRVVPDNFRWTLELKLDGVVGKRPDGVEFIGHAKNHASRIGSVGKQAGVIWQERELLVNAFARVLSDNHSFALNVALKTQVAPFVKKLAQLHDEG